MTQERNLILDSTQINQKIKRIAYEIYEKNYRENEIILAGIEGEGFTLAGLLKSQIESISPLKVQLTKVSLDKLSQVQSDVKIELDLNEIKNKVVIIIDDVLNTGRTLAYALKPFLNIELKKLQTAVIVDRSHQSYPIVADYVGYSLATTLRDRVEVNLEGQMGIYLI
ncbi:MAG: phosphoribosyltransferase family protein [Cytophagaceae bacterium]